jgi:hypothetical protein
VTMRTIPIDVGQLSGFTCALLPEAVADRETGEARTDRDSGLPLYQVGVNVRLTGTREAYALLVQVPGEPVGLVEDERVKVYDLRAVPWNRDGRSGVTYRASAVTPANAPAPGRPTTPAGSSGPDMAAAKATGGKGAAA